MSWQQRINETSVAQQERETRAAQARSGAAFRQLVRDMVDSDQLADEDRIARVLQDSGHTTDELSSACKEYEQRQRLWAGLVALHEQQMKMLAAEIEHEAVAAQFGISREIFDRQCDELATLQQHFSKQKMAEMETRCLLLQSLPAAAAGKLTGLATRVSQLRNELCACSKSIAECETYLVRFRFFESVLTARKDYRLLVEKAEEKQRTIAEQTKVADRLRRELDQAVQALNEFAREAIAP